MVRSNHKSVALRVFSIAIMMVAAISVFSFNCSLIGRADSSISLAAEPICLLHGWVNDSISMEGIDEVAVFAEPLAGDGYDLAWTNETGYYEMEVARDTLSVDCMMVGYEQFETTIDTTGVAEYRLDILLVAEPTIPVVSIELVPDANISLNNPLSVHLTAEDYNLHYIQVVIGEVHNRTGDWVNMSLVGYGLALIDDEPPIDDFEYTYDGSVADGYLNWSATCENIGYLRNASSSEYVQMNAHRMINDDSSYGLMAYYTNDTLESETGYAWFDELTGEYEEFEFFDDFSIIGESPLPEALPDDPYGVITPVQSYVQWKMNATSYEELSASVNSSMVILDSRSVSGIWFEYDEVCPSGEYIAFGTAYDNVSNMGWDECLFTVDNTYPVADAGDDQTMTIGETVTLDGSASTDNVGIVNYTWTLVIDESDTTVDLYGLEASYEFPEAGDHSVTLTVTDGGGNADTDTLIVTVEADSPPVAEAGPSTMAIPEDEPVTFDGTGSTDDVSISEYSWEIVELQEYSTGETFTFTFDTPGTYHVSLVVVDSIGQESEPDIIVVTVTAATVPVADAGVDREIDAGGTVVFDASGSSDDGAIVNYTWTFEYDGVDIILYGETVEFTFDESGEYDVSLVVTDDQGLQGSDDTIVTVRSESSSQSTIPLIAIPILGAIALAIVVAVVVLRSRSSP